MSRLTRLVSGSSLLIAGLLTLAGSSLPAQAASTPAPAASSPTMAVRALIHFYKPLKGDRLSVPARYADCLARDNSPLPRVASCPITPRLQTRLLHPDPIPKGCLGGCTLDPISRSQNTPQTLTVRLADKTARAAHVNTVWSYGSATALKFTFAVVRSGSGWLVDDEYCTGHSETTVYKVPVKPCPGK